MDGNRETILDELNDFEKRPMDISVVLEDYLARIAKTGDTMFPWVKLKPLLKRKVELVLDEFYEMCPTDSLPALPNVEIFKFDVLKSKILEAIETFQSAPFTIQRICELLTNPRKHYKRTDKFMRGLEKNILVVSTVEPNSAINELNNNNASAVVNGVVSSESEQTLAKGISNTESISSEKPDSPPHGECIGDIGSSFIVVDETAEPSLQDNTECSEPEVGDNVCINDMNENVSVSDMDVSSYTEAPMHESEEDDGYSEHHDNSEEKTASDLNASSPSSSVENFFPHSSSEVCSPSHEDTDQNSDSINGPRMMSGTFQNSCDSGHEENVISLPSSVPNEEVSYVQESETGLMQSSQAPDKSNKVDALVHIISNESSECQNALGKKSVNDDNSGLNVAENPHSPDDEQLHLSESNSDQLHPDELQCQPQSPNSLDHQQQSVADCHVHSSSDLECKPASPGSTELQSQSSTASAYMSQHTDSLMYQPISSGNQACQPLSPDDVSNTGNSACQPLSPDNVLQSPCSPNNLACQPHLSENVAEPSLSAGISDSQLSPDDSSYQPHSPDDLAYQSSSKDICQPQSPDIAQQLRPNDLLHSQSSDVADQSNDLPCQSVSANSVVTYPSSGQTVCHEKSEDAGPSQPPNGFADHPRSPDHSFSSDKSVGPQNCAGGLANVPPCPEESAAGNEFHPQSNYTEDNLHSSSFLQPFSNVTGQPQSSVYSETPTQSQFPAENSQTYVENNPQTAYAGVQGQSSMYSEDQPQSCGTFSCQPADIYQSHTQPDSTTETAMEESGAENTSLSGTVRNSSCEALEQEMMDVENHNDFAQDNCEMTNEAEAMEEG